MYTLQDKQWYDCLAIGMHFRNALTHLIWTYMGCILIWNAYDCQDDFEVITACQGHTSTLLTVNFGHIALNIVAFPFVCLKHYMKTN